MPGAYDPNTGQTWDQAGMQPWDKVVRGTTASPDFLGGLGQAASDLAPGLAVAAPFALGASGVLGAAGAAGAGNSPFMSGLDNAAISGTNFAPASGAGGGMWDWLDNISNGAPSNFGSFDPGGNLAATPQYAPFDPSKLDLSSLEGNAIPGYGSVTPGMTLDPASSGGFTDLLTKYGSNGLSALQKLLTGSGSGGGLGGGGSLGSGILGQFGSDPLGAAFNMTPFLLASGLAAKQSGDLNGVLDGINSAGYTKSILDPYDMETGATRAGMVNDQGLRGVAGSSFGDQSLNNFDYTRALGRGDLASKAGLASASLTGSLINQRNTNTNMLLGAGLNASAGLFKPQSDPFNLRALLGA